MTDEQEQAQTLHVEGYGSVEFPDDLTTLSDQELVELMDEIGELFGKAEAIPRPETPLRLFRNIISYQYRLMAELGRRSLDVDTER